MEYSFPRIMIAGTGSGCGKTTVTSALLKALSDRNQIISAYKCGPDYIDTMFHEHILGRSSTNLDSFFFDENTLKWLLVKNRKNCDLGVIEGVMGFYDGLGIDSTKASSYEISQLTQTPVILVLNAKGSALSLLAVIHGFMTFQANNNIRGVILNQCSAMTYSALAKAITACFKGRIKPFGYLPLMPECSLESRHLGLITAGEIEDLDQKTAKLDEQAQKTIDLDGILELAAQAPALSCNSIQLPVYQTSVRIAVAQDKAFCFYYHDNLDILKQMGAEIVPFSPLSDASLPGNIHGLYLGGGYPELYAEKLSKNITIRQAVLRALQEQIPCIAECGGFMYITQSIADFPMTGFLQGSCYNNQKLTRFGYNHLRAGHKNMLFDEGEEIPAHEFHYWDCTETGFDFTAVKPSGKQWQCGYASDHLYAGFPHFHFYAKPSAAIRFYEACLRYKEKQNG